MRSVEENYMIKYGKLKIYAIAGNLLLLSPVLKYHLSFAPFPIIFLQEGRDLHGLRMIGTWSQINTQSTSFLEESVVTGVYSIIFMHQK